MSFFFEPNQVIRLRNGIPETHFAYGQGDRPPEEAIEAAHRIAEAHGAAFVLLKAGQVENTHRWWFLCKAADEEEICPKVVAGLRAHGFVR